MSDIFHESFVLEIREEVYKPGLVPSFTDWCLRISLPVVMLSGTDLVSSISYL